MKKEAGSIEVGKRANFTISEKDQYSVAPKDLKYI
jgi:predicted amidohydrolase YtcJ